jgi:cellulose synthase/poly-beta-1,6-N-acetylglucosamine synthase-like glycosyltransferase
VEYPLVPISGRLNHVLTKPPIQREVAVVLPCYNAEPHLQRALDSVFVQTYPDFHVYAVDDGSTDRTAKILESNAHRCSFLSQPNAGPAAARNRAIRMSDSPFLAFLDADDEWMPHKLEHQIALLKHDSTLGMVCSGCLPVEARSENRANPIANSTPLSGRLFQNLVLNCFVFTPTVVVRRRCLEQVGLFDESLPVCEDFNLWLRIAARWQVAFMPVPLAVTYKRPASLSASISPEKRLKAGVAALTNVQSACPDLSPAESDALRIALAERHYFHGSFLLATGANRHSRRSLISALKLQPTRWKALAKLGLSFLPTGSPKRIHKDKEQSQAVLC